MNNKQLIKDIFELETEIKILRDLLVKSDEINKKTLTPFDEAKQEIFFQGLKSSVSEYFNPFVLPAVIFNEDRQEFVSFNAWVQEVTIDKYNRGYLPDTVQDKLTNKQIIELYEPYLKYKYDLKLRDKKNELENESCES